MSEARKSKERDACSGPHNSDDVLSELDEEWLKVLREAIDSGVSKHQFRQFLEKEWQRRKQESQN